MNSMEQMLLETVLTAVRWADGFRANEDNPRKLLAAMTREQSDAATRECTRGMEALQKAEGSLFEAASAFFITAVRTEIRFRLDLAERHPAALLIGFAAVRFLEASLESSVDPSMLSSSGPQSAQSGRYFAARGDLVGAVERRSDAVERLRMALRDSL